MVRTNSLSSNFILFLTYLVPSSSYCYYNQWYAAVTCGLTTTAHILLERGGEGPLSHIDIPPHIAKGELLLLSTSTGGRLQRKKSYCYHGGTYCCVMQQLTVGRILFIRYYQQCTAPALQGPISFPPIVVQQATMHSYSIKLRAATTLLFTTTRAVCWTVRCSYATNIRITLLKVKYAVLYLHWEVEISFLRLCFKVPQVQMGQKRVCIHLLVGLAQLNLYLPPHLFF